MYYFVMKTIAKSKIHLNICSKRDRSFHLSENLEIPLSIKDIKFYQKFFVVFITLSTILIFPESPKEIEKICKNYNSGEICAVL